MARMIVAKNGYNIDSDKRFISIDSNNDNLMIIEEVDITGTDTEYTHGLGYLPATLEFYKYDSKWFPLGSDAVDSDLSLAGFWTPITKYDTNKIYISNNDSLPAKIFIFGNSADNQTGSGKTTATGKLKIAKSGLDATSVTDIRQFRFCSGRAVLKKDMDLSGSVSVALETSETVTHSLGYPPVVIASVSGGDILPTNIGAFDFSPIGFWVTNSTVVFYNKGTDPSVTINYTIFRDKIN